MAKKNNPEEFTRPSLKDTKRFLSRVEVKGDCWEWQGCKCPKGYGRCKVDGKSRWCHRISYAIFKGLVPADLHIHHLCGNPACVNPDHLVPEEISVNSVNHKAQAIAASKKSECCPI